ncbi:MAG TPA: VOC family protein [Alphaproteobacteria bacterium]|nr:VOC family protein [Alphaproteobacteria bacterium]
MPKITPCLWFDGKAEEAMNFYRSIFPDTEILSVMRTSAAGPGPEGSVLAVTFRLQGQEIMGLNGGPYFSFTPAMSFFVTCDTQAEVDSFWEKLLEGGKPSQCGWLTDKYGLSWQIVPKRLGELQQDPDRAKAARVVQAMLKMVKLDIAGLERAAAG